MKSIKNYRPAIIRLFEQGFRVMEISRMLQVKRQTVSKAIKRFQETGTNEDRKGRGRPRTANISVIRRKILRRIKRNPSTQKNSTRKLAKAVGISVGSVHGILKRTGMKARKLVKAHGITKEQKLKRLTRCKNLLRRFAAGRYRRILFTDEKWFDVEQAYNHQNDRVYSKEPLSPEEAIVFRKQNPQQVMVWAGVTYNGKTDLIFVPPGVKVKGPEYRSMLEDKVQPWTQRHFGQEDWTFQQDGAPSHKAKETQQWIAKNFPDWITVDISPQRPGEWPANSPDLNPMDYSIWSILESKACTKPHASIEALKTDLIKAWKEITMETINKAIDDFPKRLRACINVAGGHFEHT